MQQNAEVRISDASYTSYAALMIMVTSLGFLGNTAMIIVLRQVEHRNKQISYLMINLGVSNIIICSFGYTISLAHHLRDFKVAMEEPLRCDWIAFSNATTGIACIWTLTLMSVSQYRGITKITVPSYPQNRLNKRRILLSITAIWVISIALSIPPMFGWNRFIPVPSGVSCHPDWASQEVTDKTYIWFLVTGGFFVPLTVICVSYGMTYRFMRRLTLDQIGERARIRRLAQQKKLNRMLIAAILAFILSWSPYCFASLVSNFEGHHVIPPSLSLVPEAMAKASVIYNPIIFTCFNRSFRTTLVRMICALVLRINCCHGEPEEVPGNNNNVNCLCRSYSEPHLGTRIHGQRVRAFTIVESIQLY